MPLLYGLPVPALQIQFIKSIITAEFGVEHARQEIGQVLLARKKSFLNDYLEENKDEADSLLMEYPSAYNLAESLHLLVSFHSSTLLTLAIHSYSYTGGAHGNYGTSFVVLNLATKRKLTLNQVLTSAGIKRLGSLLEKQFRKDRGLKTTSP